MNIIQSQAENFYSIHYNDGGDYDDFISELKSELYKYRKIPHRLEFVEYILFKLKMGSDLHLIECSARDKTKCSTNINYENALFFVQNEKEELLEQMLPSDFNNIEKENTNRNLQEIIADINLIKLGQELTYDDFIKEFNELKDLYYLNKKNWTQLLIGKLTEMTASGIISETICKQIVESVTKHYEGIIQ
jgi:hypothetical protein